MQTIRPHSPRVMLALGAALLSVLVLLIAASHAGPLSLGGGTSPSSQPRAAATPAVASSTDGTLQAGLWKPFTFPFHRVVMPWSLAKHPGSGASCAEPPARSTKRGVATHSAASACLAPTAPTRR